MHIDIPMIERFKELAVGYLTGSLSEHEADEFVRLYRSSPEFVKIFDETERLYTDSMIIRFEGERTINYAVVKSRIEKASRRRRFFAVLSSVAAAVVVGLFTLNHLWTNADEQILQQDMVCRQVTDDTHMILPDGSSVSLKAGSVLSYNPERFETERLVSLEGEACFDVRHDMYRPFVVKTESMNVKVLGTVFNVNTMRPGKIVETTLARGSIVIQDVKGEDLLFVRPGQQVIYEGSEHIKVNELRAWEYLLERYGTVTIPDAPLSEIVDVLERVYGRKIVVAIPEGVCPMVTFGFNKGDECSEVIERLAIVSGCKVSALK
jgi:ferric-dicitrate binding protein FerR (iron transport regulator)